MFILYIAAILVAGLTTIQTSCPVDWAEFSGECYYFGNVHRSWLDAENHCRRMHGYLLTDDNSAKHTFVSNILSVLHSLRQNAFWIGASDYTIEQQFRWLETGLPIGNFSAWGPGKPSQNDTKNCVRMFYNGVDYKWEDVDCNDRGTNFICEKPAENTENTENILLTTTESIIIGK